MRAATRSQRDGRGGLLRFGLAMAVAALALSACGGDGGETGGVAAGDDDGGAERCEVDAVVFVQPEADQAQIDAIERQLESIDAVGEVHHLDAEATQPRFGEAFADVPADGSEAPTSFEVVFGGSVERTAFVEDLLLTEGVGEVAFVNETC